MTARDLLLRYKQTVMGFGWAIFMPLVNTADLLGDLHARGARSTWARPYPMYAFCGLRGVELLRLVAALLGDVADEQSEPRDQGLLPARDLPVLGGARLACRLRGRRRSVLVALMALLPHRRRLAAADAAGRLRWRIVIFTAAAGAAARDGEPLLPRRQVPVRDRHRGLDVRDLGRLSDRTASAGGSARLLALNPMTPSDRRVPGGRCSISAMPGDGLRDHRRGLGARCW